MPIDVTLEPRGRTFIPSVLTNQKFRSTGFLTGRSSSGYSYVVINPRKHPFYVWKKTGSDDTSYVTSARALGAAAVSNGPMMAGFSPDEIKRKLIAAFGWWGLLGLAGGAILGALICVLSVGVGCALWSLLMGLAVGGSAGITGVGLKVIRILEGGAPFNIVRGVRHGINDPGANVNSNLVWFGREPSPDFPSFKVGAGASPGTLVEMSAGLIPLILNFSPMTNIPGRPNYNEAYKNLEQAAGTIAWALIPLGLPAGGTPVDTPGSGEAEVPSGALTPSELQGINLVMDGDTTPLRGVIMTIGKYSSQFNQEMVALLASIGTRDAVAMDGSDSVMLGSGNEIWVGPPPFYKDHIQKYGFYCQ